jgi:hypothetical protein
MVRVGGGRWAGIEGRGDREGGGGGEGVHWLPSAPNAKVYKTGLSIRFWMRVLTYPGYIHLWKIVPVSQDPHLVYWKSDLVDVRRSRVRSSTSPAVHLQQL